MNIEPTTRPITVEQVKAWQEAGYDRHSAGNDNFPNIEWYPNGGIVVSDATRIPYNGYDLTAAVAAYNAALPQEPAAEPTPGPWVYEKDVDPITEDADMYFVQQDNDEADFIDRHIAIVHREEDARYICAAVNACSAIGLTHADLTKPGFAKKVKEFLACEGEVN